jgi:hypothetical protein
MKYDKAVEIRYGDIRWKTINYDVIRYDERPFKTIKYDEVRYDDKVR